MLSHLRAAIQSGVLQWDRDRAVADNQRWQAGSTAGSQLQWDRDRAVADKYTASRYRAPGARFNGTATGRSRIKSVCWWSKSRYHWLQWDRDRAVADNSMRDIVSVIVPPASMGPRPRGRG